MAMIDDECNVFRALFSKVRKILFVFLQQKDCIHNNYIPYCQKKFGAPNIGTDRDYSAKNTHRIKNKQ